MTKTFECWGADKPFANITEKSLAKTIGLAVSSKLSDLLLAIFDIVLFYCLYKPKNKHVPFTES
jgi:hypothetical protein